MKNRFIRSFLGLSLSFMLLVLPITFNTIEEVRADDSCYVQTNYYLFNYVVDISHLRNSDGTYNLPNTVEHSSTFSDELPEGAKVSTAKFKWLNMSNAEDGWDGQYFWNFANDFPTKSNSIYKNNNTHTWVYLHDTIWNNESNSSTRDDNVDASKYNINEVLASTYIAPASNGSVAPSLSESTGGQVKFHIKRTIGQSWKSFSESQQSRYSNGKHPTDRHIWLPAVLKVTVDVCTGNNNSNISTGNNNNNNNNNDSNNNPNMYKVITTYIDRDTKEQIKDPKNVGTFKVGEEYSDTCDSTIGDYTLVSKKGLTGIMPAKDVTLVCEYSKSDNPTYKVTVNYLDKNTKKPIKDPYTYPTNYKPGDNYAATCLDSINGSYILDGYNGNLTGKINDKDITIDCLYTTEANRTSDVSTYIVWVAAGLSLGYTVYYLIKHFKKVKED